MAKDQPVAGNDSIADSLGLEHDVRKPWTTPLFHTVAAGEAELTNSNVGSDGVLFS